MPEPSGYIVPPPGLGNGAPPRSRPQDSRGRFQTGAKGQGDRRPRSDERQPRADDRKPREDRAPRPESRSRENPARSEERRTTRPERQFTRREQPARSRDDELGPVVPHESAAPRTAAKPVKKPFWKLKSGGKPRGEGRAAPSGAAGRRKV